MALLSYNYGLKYRFWHHTKVKKKKKMLENTANFIYRYLMVLF